MIVVSNTSPINYLILIEQIQLLPQLFGKIIIPQAVYSELSAPLAPAGVRDWISTPPHWLDIQAVSLDSNSRVDLLDPGERAAILLAQEINANLLLIDEIKARQIAREQGLTITGILGILDRAAMLKLIHLPTAVSQLKQTSFRASEGLFQKLLAKHV